MRVVSLVFVLFALQSGHGLLLKLPQLKKPENFTTIEWTKYLENIKPKSDGVVTKGTKPQPASSGHVMTRAKPVQSHVIGGTSVASGQLPWQVSLLSETNTFLCGGALIAEDLVITAAHCVFNVTRLKVVLGTVKISGFDSGRYIAETSQKIVHPQWNIQTLSNNVALVRLPLPINTSVIDHIKPIRMPSMSQQSQSFEGVKVVLSGWGRTSQDSTYSDVLNSAELTVLNNANCSRFFGSKVINSATLCVNAGQQAALCFGDGGGPLSYLDEDGIWTLLGISSFVPKSGCTAGPSGFVRVTALLPWISSAGNMAIRQ